MRFNILFYIFSKTLNYYSKFQGSIIPLTFQVGNTFVWTFRSQRPKISFPQITSQPAYYSVANNEGAVTGKESVLGWVEELSLNVPMSIEERPRKSSTRIIDVPVKSYGSRWLKNGIFADDFPHFMGKIWDKIRQPDAYITAHVFMDSEKGSEIRWIVIFVTSLRTFNFW